MSDSETFDTDLFIEEIHNLPCIWDYTKEEYSNRNLKNKAWETICKKFYEDFDEKDTKEKNQCATNLQRKWRSLRDSFNRDLKKQNTQKSAGGSGAGSAKRYYYYSQLSFLKPLSTKRSTASSLRVQNKDDDVEKIDIEDESTTGTTDSEFPTKKNPKSASKKKEDAEYGLIKKLTSHLSDRVSVHTQERVDSKSYDSDMHFLLSLYDRFKSIHSDMKLNAQIEILNVIKKYTTPTYNYNHYGQGYTTPAYAHQVSEQPSTSRTQFMHDMETGSPQISGLRTTTTSRDLLVQESPSSVSSQASNYNDPILTDIFRDD